MHRRFFYQENLAFCFQLCTVVYLVRYVVPLVFLFLGFMLVQLNELESLNNQAELEFFTYYDNEFRDNAVNDDPYYGINLSSKFYDLDTLSSLCSKEKSAIYLSINIQSLMSKHEQLSMELNDLKQKNVNVDVIAIQETWDLRYPELVPLDGFNPIIFKKRRDMRGGGVGFYVRTGLNPNCLW